MVSIETQNEIITGILDSYINKSNEVLKIQGYAKNEDFIESLMFVYYDYCDTILNLTRMEIISGESEFIALASLLAHKDVIFEEIRKGY